MEKIVVQIDGGCRDNPGPGAWGVVIKKGENIEELCGFLTHCTNNQAEYRALEAACITLLAKGQSVVGSKVEIWSDSQLIVNQINGLWSVKTEDLRPFYLSTYEVYTKLASVSNLTLHWFRREHNVVADALCNKVMDRHGIVCSRKGIKRSEDPD